MIKQYKTLAPDQLFEVGWWWPRPIINSIQCWPELQI